MHTIKAAAYAKHGRRAEVFVTRLAPELTANDIKDHVKKNLDIDCVVELIKATNNYTSFHISATCRLPGVFMDPKLWPEGALVRWWRAPRVKPPTISNDVIQSDEVSDETMRGVPMPNDSFHSARENVSTMENQLISDSTMANIQVPSFHSSSNEDSDTETNTHPESLFVRSPIRTRSVSRNRPVQRSRSELDLRND